MKIKMLLPGAAIAAFTFTSFAADALLSPRAKDNQSSVVTGSIETQGGMVMYVTSNSSALGSPRAKDNQINVVKGANNDANSAATCGKMAGSPKMVAECASHPGAPMPCCVAAEAK